MLLFLHLSQRVIFPKSYSTRASQVNFCGAFGFHLDGGVEDLSATVLLHSQCVVLKYKSLTG